MMNISMHDCARPCTLSVPDAKDDTCPVSEQYVCWRETGGCSNWQIPSNGLTLSQAAWHSLQLATATQAGHMYIDMSLIRSLRWNNVNSNCRYTCAYLKG